MSTWIPGVRASVIRAAPGGQAGAGGPAAAVAVAVVADDTDNNEAKGLRVMKPCGGLSGRVLLAALGTGAVLLGASVPAAAQPKPPNCTSADFAGVLSGVTASTSVYLFTHPYVNDFLTTFGDVPDEERQAKLQTFLDANPQVKDELQAIRQPSLDFRNRCGLPPGRDLTP